MSRSELRQVLVELLADIAPELDAGELDDGAELAEALDLDSMDHLTLMEGVAERLGVEVPERDYPRLRTLGGALGYLEQAAARGAR